MITQKTATLRVCGSCEWIFRGKISCPRCSFGSYGARFVYGDKCYKYEYTQEPYLNNKLTRYRWALIKRYKIPLRKERTLIAAHKRL